MNLLRGLAQRVERLVLSMTCRSNTRAYPIQVISQRAIPRGRGRVHQKVPELLTRGPQHLTRTKIFEGNRSRNPNKHLYALALKHYTYS